jgi:hypothetical protein
MSIYAPLLFLFLFGTLQCMVATTAAISEGVHAPEFCKGRRGVASVPSPLMLVDYISVPTLSACRYPPPKPLYFPFDSLYHLNPTTASSLSRSIRNALRLRIPPSDPFLLTLCWATGHALQLQRDRSRTFCFLLRGAVPRTNEPEILLRGIRLWRTIWAVRPIKNMGRNSRVS